jgi:hypothetical protein
MKREKQRQISIPILPKAQKIIDKYLIDNCVFPAVSNQKNSTYLKEIATITKLIKGLHTTRLGKHLASYCFTMIKSGIV